MLGYMMRDENIGVLKRVVVCFIQLYRLALLVRLLVVAWLFMTFV